MNENQLIFKILQGLARSTATLGMAAQIKNREKLDPLLVELVKTSNAYDDMIMKHLEENYEADIGPSIRKAPTTPGN